MERGHVGGLNVTVPIWVKYHQSVVNVIEKVITAPYLIIPSTRECIMKEENGKRKECEALILKISSRAVHITKN